MDVSTRKLLTGNKFLSFKLRDEEYCLGIEVVQEIMALPEITPLPQTPDFINGIINLRGKMIPVIDLNRKFDFPEMTYGHRTCVIVINFVYEGTDTHMGIIVDETQEVITIDDANISAVPYVNAKIRSEYIKGVAEYEDTIKIILDITRVLGDEEFTLLTNAAKGPEKEEQAK